MKKMFVAFGIAFALIVGVFAIVNTPVDAEALNAESYEMVCEKVDNEFVDSEDYEITPRITRNGIVESYKIVDADGEVVAYADVDRG